MHMKHISFWWAVLCLLCASASAQVRLNEVMPCNLSTVLDRDYYNFSGFVELYNGSDTAATLNGCELIHYKKTEKGNYKEKWRHEFTQDVQLESKAYRLLWMDENTKIGHVPYKLDADGGCLLLMKNGETLDSLVYEKSVPHVSYGRYGNTTGYMTPSPLLANTQSFDSLRTCAAPQFDRQPGLVDEPFLLSLSTETDDATIYYTTNGTEPSADNGFLYTQPFYVGTTTAIRSVAVKEGMLASKPSTATFIFPDEKHEQCGGYTIPIVAITVDSLYFYDDTLGMCVKGKNGVRAEKKCDGTYSTANYNRDWKRPINFEYIVDGKQELSVEVEASVEGGCSRELDIKSLALKTSKKSGQEVYDYYFFQSKPDIHHQTLYIRNGGTAYSQVRFRDGLMQTFAIDMDIDYQAYQPVAYYINGNYMGLMNLNERTNSDYVTANYGIDEDDIDLVTISDQLGVRASKGDLTAYNSMVNFVYDSDQTDSTFYEKACELIDMPEYMDYQVIQQFVVNTDWPGNNTKIWRERKENSKFRWILFDMDFGLGLKGSGYTTASNVNMFNWCQGKGIHISWANKESWMTKIFKGLSKNVQFRQDFIETFKRHLATTFSVEHIEAVFDSMTAILDAEYCATFGRTATEAAASMKTFALSRPEIIESEMKGYLNIDTLGVDEVLMQPLMLVYPNPTAGELHVMSECPIVSVTLLSVDGRELLSRKVEDTYVELDVSNVPQGVYLMRLSTEQGVFIRRVLKE